MGCCRSKGKGRGCGKGEDEEGHEGHEDEGHEGHQGETETETTEPEQPPQPEQEYYDNQYMCLLPVEPRQPDDFNPSQKIGYNAKGEPVTPRTGRLVKRTHSTEL